MMTKRRLPKTVDEVARIRCATGIRSVREEVWEDEEGNVQRYNLAFINHSMTSRDNGRVLGYDNSNGHHHRHYKGTVETVSFKDYESISARFVQEVGLLKREKA